jgi:hypothetical protein
MVGQLRHHEFLRHAYCDAFIFSPGLSTRSAAIYADCITSWSELTSATIVRSGYTLISIAGLFDIACREWRTKATAAKAMPAFQMKFRLGNQARRLIATGTAPQLAPHPNWHRTAPQLAPQRTATGTAPQLAPHRNWHRTATRLAPHRTAPQLPGGAEAHWAICPGAHVFLCCCEGAVDECQGKYACLVFCSDQYR